jgi:toxin ParE1/3/4
MKLRLTPKAEEDVIGRYGYGVTTFGVDQTEQYYAALNSTFLLLVDQPLLARERIEFTPPVRIHFHGSHVMVYVVVDGTLLIVRVRGNRQDWARVLSGH